MLPSKRVCHTNTITGMSSLESQSMAYLKKPHYSLCSRTGIVYNVTPSAVGVIVYKVVGNRYIEKRVNIRVEHIRHSKCRQEFLDRVKKNHDLHAEAKTKGGMSVLLCLRSTLIFTTPQSVFSSSASLSFPAPHTPSQRRTTHHRPWSLYATRPLSKMHSCPCHRLYLHHFFSGYVLSLSPTLCIHAMLSIHHEEIVPIPVSYLRECIATA